MDGTGWRVYKRTAPGNSLSHTSLTMADYYIRNSISALEEMNLLAEGQKQRFSDAIQSCSESVISLNLHIEHILYIEAKYRHPTIRSRKLRSFYNLLYKNNGNKHILSLILDALNTTENEEKLLFRYHEIKSMLTERDIQFPYCKGSLTPKYVLKLHMLLCANKPSC